MAVDSVPSPRGYWCQACREIGCIHCNDPVNCGGMKLLARAEIDAAAEKLGLTKTPSAQGGGQ